MGDRFRLIYMKSTGPEKSMVDQSPLLLDSEKISGMAPIPTTTQSSIPKAFSSSQTMLKQAKADLKHADPKVRMLAIQYLEKCDPSIAIPLIQEILSDQDPDVRAQGLSTLIKFQDTTVGPLLKKYLRDRDPRVRIAALRGIFKHKEGVDLNILLQFLSDESLWVRRKVATLLGWTQMEGVFPILVELSKDEDSSVRRAALFSMMTMYPEESENRLLEAMSDSDPDLRKWARRALENRVRSAERPGLRKVT